MNVHHLQEEASELYFAFRSESDAATMKEIRYDYNKFSDKLLRYVASGELKLKIAQALLKIIDTAR